MNSPASFFSFRHYMFRCRWGRRFRLPTPYVHAQTASSLASGYLGADLSFCYMAVGGISAEEPIWVGRRKRLPHAYPRAVVRGSRSRDGQSSFRAGLVAGHESGENGSRCDPAWRDWTAVLSITGLGDYAQSCARFVAAPYTPSCDYTMVERVDRSASQSNLEPHGRSLLAG
jgi:hypothetical protein